MVTSKLDLPRPESLRQPGERVEGQTHVVRKKVPGIHIPATLEGALKNHVYTTAIDEDSGQEVKAYIEVPFDAAANQYPKMLYHPDWGKVREPKISDFAKAGTTGEHYQAALELFTTAHNEWDRGNRTQVAANPKREAELRKIGWVDYKDLKHLGAEQTKADSDAL